MTYVMSTAGGAFNPDAQLKPLLSVEEAQDVIAILAAVLDGGEVDEQAAYNLLANLSARVPSRDHDS